MKNKRRTSNNNNNNNPPTRHTTFVPLTPLPFCFRLPHELPRRPGQPRQEVAHQHGHNLESPATAAVRVPALQGELPA